MASKTNFLLTLLLFNSLFFPRVIAQPPTEAPNSAPMPSSSPSNTVAPMPSSSPSKSGANGSSVAPMPSSSPSKSGANGSSVAPMPSSSSSNSGANGSSVAPSPTPTTTFNCPLNPVTLLACYLVIDGSVFWLPKQICCRGIQGLLEQGISSCIGNALSSYAKKGVGTNFNVPEAKQIVSRACLIH